MAFRRASRTPDESTGTKEELSAFSKQAGIYLKSRTELLALEGKEAGRILGRRLTVLIIGIGALIVSYLAFLITVIYLVGQWFDQLGDGLFANWAGAALLITIVHLIIAFICFKTQRKIGKTDQLFEYTRAEWQKDQQWIQNDEKQS
ncbi:MAG: phage holin family protein [Akkermansiaceae bacterium]|nr:phage holin family protein [Akkermansiaceae bacterium]